MESKILNVNSVEFSSLIEEFTLTKQLLSQRKYTFEQMLWSRNKECETAMLHYNEIRNNLLNSIDDYIDEEYFELNTGLKLMSLIIKNFTIDKKAICVCLRLFEKIFYYVNNETKECLFLFKNLEIDDVADVKYIEYYKGNSLAINLSKIDYTYMFGECIGALYNYRCKLNGDLLIIEK